MLKFLGNGLYKIQIPIGIHSKIYTFLEGFRMHVTKHTHVIHSLTRNKILLIYITIHPSLTNADFLEDKKKLKRLRLEPTNYGLESSVVHY